MSDELVSALIGVSAGAFGYLVVTFWVRPILRYRDIRSGVLFDLVYYAQVINANGLNDSMKSLYEERTLSNRRRSAEITACLLELPCWYKYWIKMRGERPVDAARNLIGFSNTSEYMEGSARVDKIRKALGITSEIDF
jgi:hypothetical protein